MKRVAPLLLLALILTLVFAPVALAAAAAAAPAKTSDRSPAAPIATAISTVTGIAISPLLGTGGYGAYKWFTAKDEAARAALPWYAQMKFWLPALLIVAVCAAKDSFGAVVPPGWKKPLDVLEAMENKFSGLVAAGAVVPFAIDTMGDLLLHGNTTAAAPLLAGTGLATLPLGAADFSWLLNILTVPFAVVVFAMVWLASHAINVLILLSPWGAIDAALKAARTSLLGLIVVTGTINLWVGALLSLVVIVIAFFVAGWAFRLTTFGTIFCWDFLTLRRARFTPAADRNAMFAGANLTGVPVRTYGRLARKQDGGLEFVYRPWLVLPVRSIAIPAEQSKLAVAEGLFFSDIAGPEDHTFFLLPPRYHGHEAEVARIYELGGGVRPAGLRKAWSALREMLGGRAMPAPALTA